jgi:hypothetical protein
MPLPLVLCPACSERGWSDGPHHLSGDDLALYLELRRRERPKAPHGWWLGTEGLERGTAILRWHIQREQGAVTREAVLERASLRTLEQAHLFGWFNNRDRALSVFDAFTFAFPELAIQPWELPGQVPWHFWEAGDDEARAQAMRWWLERLGLSAHEVLAQLETRACGIERQLREAGLGDLAHDRGLRALLHLVEPTIPIEPPPASASASGTRPLWRAPAAASTSAAWRCTSLRPTRS